MARSAPQSAHRYPLTTILGSDAHVRVLRELSRHGGQLSAPSLVSRTGLAKTSVWAALTSLAQAGVVSVAGTGRARLYSIRSDHPLRGVLDALFEAEERRFGAPRYDPEGLREGRSPRLRCRQAATRASLVARLVALTLQPFPQRFPMAPNRLGGFARATLGRFLVGASALHFPKHALSLHLLFEHAEGCVDIVVAHENSHEHLRSGLCTDCWPASLRRWQP